MEYLTVKEAGKKWGITVRMVKLLLLVRANTGSNKKRKPMAYSSQYGKA